MYTQCHLCVRSVTNNVHAVSMHVMLLSLSPQFGERLSNDTTTTAQMRHDFSLSLSLRRETFYNQALSPRFGGSISMTNNQPAQSLSLSLSISLSILLYSQPVSDTRRSSSRSVLSWEGVLETSLCSIDLLQDSRLFS